MSARRKLAPACLALAVALCAQRPAGARVIATAPGQPAGALSGRIVFTSGGHGWTYDNARDGWFTQRGDSNDLVEDYGNLDQMNFFATYCFNAGATVVAMRPIGYQTNEVVLDNVSPSVRFSGNWADSTATINYYGVAGAVPYRYASIAAAENATATYAPTLPAAGFYPVYTWVSHGANRTSQLYKINHTGGQALVRVPHHMVGNGWVYLGSYFFNAGSNSVNGAVVISSLQPSPVVGSVVIADAIRFGNGMGDVVPVSTGGGVPEISGYPREEECSRYWVQRSLGIGQPSSLYNASDTDQNGNTGTPPRMAAEMNREGAGNQYKRVYLGFHSNASGTPPTARGCIGLYNNTNLNFFPGTATPNQFRLAQLVASEVNTDMAAQPNLETNWSSRSTANLTYARTDYAFGEINNLSIGNEFDATIIEVGFHDHPADALLLRDPKVRNVMARASYQAVVRYMNEFDAAPLTFLPEPPASVRAIANQSGGIAIAWDAPGTGGGGATGYLVYRSTNGYGFGQPAGVAGGGATSLTLTNLAADTDWYFRVAATNAGGESLPSETVGCRRSSTGDSPVLFVNGFDRFDRTLNLRQTAGPGIGSVFGGTQTFDRVQPRRNNSFDYVTPHGQAISRNGVAFNSCQNETVLNGQVSLGDYQTVIWALGNESTADETFSSAEQTRVAQFLNGGGRLFVSGAEVAWDLDRDSGPTASDRAFLNNQLHADLGGDAHDDAGTYTFAATAGGIFAGNATGRFDDGTAGIYTVPYPDVLTPIGGAQAALTYTGGSGGAAAIQFTNAATGSKVVYFGFPFETITNAAVRESAMFDILAFFGAIPAPVLAAPALQVGGGTVTISWSAIPAKKYRVQYKNDLGAITWTTLGADVTANAATASKTDATIGSVRQRFYRVLIVE